MTEWVPVSWDAVKTGDRGARVQIHRPTGFIEGTLEHRDAESVLIGFAAGQEHGLHSTRFYRRDGWNLFVPAPTGPPLPTELYTTITVEQRYSGNTNTRKHNLTLLTASAEDRTPRWSYDNGMTWSPDDYGQIESFEIVAQPVATTAKQIIDRIDAMRANGEVTTLGQVQALLAAEFGVS